MSTSPPNSGKIELPLNQAVAYVIGVPTVVLGPLAYWQYGSSLFGSSGLTKLFVLAGIGGLVSFALFAGRRRWFIGATLGLIAGLGASGLHVLYTATFHKESMLTTESGLVSLIGAGPAMGLLGYILRRDKANVQQIAARNSRRAGQLTGL